MNEKPSVEKAEEQASLMRQGAGNYANLCGVLAGFGMVMIVLVLTPGFFPQQSSNTLEAVLILLGIACFGQIIAALQFIGISMNQAWIDKSLEEMDKDFDHAAALVPLFSAILLASIAVMAYAKGGPI